MWNVNTWRLWALFLSALKKKSVTQLVSSQDGSVDWDCRNLPFKMKILVSKCLTFSNLIAMKYHLLQNVNYLILFCYGGSRVLCQMVSGVASNEMSASFAALKKVHLINLFFSYIVLSSFSFPRTMTISGACTLEFPCGTACLPAWSLQRCIWAVVGKGVCGGVLVPSSLGTGSLMNQNSQKTFYIPEAYLLYDVATSTVCHSLIGF